MMIKEQILIKITMEFAKITLVIFKIVKFAKIISKIDETHLKLRTV